MPKIFINTDGGSRGNPGIAGAGAVVSDEAGQVLQKASQPLGTATNNEAEYQAVIQEVDQFFDHLLLKYKDIDFSNRRLYQINNNLIGNSDRLSA